MKGVASPVNVSCHVFLSVSNTLDFQLISVFDLENEFRFIGNEIISRCLIVRINPEWCFYHYNHVICASNLTKCRLLQSVFVEIALISRYDFRSLIFKHDNL